MSGKMKHRLAFKQSLTLGTSAMCGSSMSHCPKELVHRDKGEREEVVAVSGTVLVHYAQEDTGRQLLMRCSDCV